jgi:hypothetical protein
MIGKRTVTNNRSRPIPEHAYTFPVVREIPPTPPDPIGAQAVW